MQRVSDNVFQKRGGMDVWRGRRGGDESQYESLALSRSLNQSVLPELRAGGAATVHLLASRRALCAQE